MHQAYQYSVKATHPRIDGQDCDRPQHMAPTRDHLAHFNIRSASTQTYCTLDSTGGRLPISSISDLHHAAGAFGSGSRPRRHLIVDSQTRDCVISRAFRAASSPPGNRQSYTPTSRTCCRSRSLTGSEVRDALSPGWTRAFVTRAVQLLSTPPSAHCHMKYVWPCVD